MAFPTTGILDSGVGSDAEPITGSWSQPLFTGELGLRRTSNRIAPNSAGAGNAWWNAAEFGPGSEVYCEVGVMPTTGQFIQMFVRLQNEGGSNPPGPDAYMARMIGNSSGAETVRLYERLSGTATALGADITSESFVVGDAFGLEVSGTSITAYRRSGGVWASIGTRTSGGVSAAGPIGLELEGSGIRVVNFGGGTITSSPVFPPVGRSSNIGWLSRGGG